MKGGVEIRKSGRFACVKTESGPVRYSKTGKPETPIVIGEFQLNCLNEDNYLQVIGLMFTHQTSMKSHFFTFDPNIIWLQTMSLNFREWATFTGTYTWHSDFSPVKKSLPHTLPALPCAILLCEAK